MKILILYWIYGGSHKNAFLLTEFYTFAYIKKQTTLLYFKKHINYMNIHTNV